MKAKKKAPANRAEKARAPKLIPAQHKAYDFVLGNLDTSSIFTLWGARGRGMTTVLGALQHATGGKLITAGDIVEATMKESHPLFIEDALYRLFVDSLNSNQVVLVDDFHLVNALISGCHHFYPPIGFSRIGI